MTYSAAARALANATNVVVTTHINPDGDGIGAALALIHALRGRGCSVRFYCPSAVAPMYKFLPGFAALEVVEQETSARRRKPCDLLISCDCGDRKRLGAVASMPHGQLINLDHHASNDRFGQINVVDTKAASTGVVVEKLLRRLGVPLDTTLAECLYTTLVFDTGRFMHSNTTASVFRLAARLLDTGIDAGAINRALTYTKKPIDLAVQRLGLERLVIDSSEPRLAGITLSAADISALDGEVEDWGDLVDIPRSLQGVEVAYLLRDEPGQDGIRCSLRANPPYVVGTIAQHYGGGGHHQAAGCTIEGELSSVVNDIRKRLRQAIRTVGKT